MYRKYLISALQPRYSSFLGDILDRNGKGTFGMGIQQPSPLYETGSKSNRMKTILSIAAIFWLQHVKSFLSSRSTFPAPKPPCVHLTEQSRGRRAPEEGSAARMVNSRVLGGGMEQSWLGHEGGRRAGSF